MDMQDLNRLEKELENLRIRYEQYFMGIERIEPADERKRVRRQIVVASETYTANTAVKFRAQNLKSRLASYENYWNRINKQIEEGTYFRQQFRLRMRQQAEQTGGGGGTGHVDLNSPEEGTSNPYDDVVQQYRQAQQKAGQDPASEKKLQQMLKKQEQQLRKQYNAKKVEFRVEMQDGKPKLKARPKK